MTSEFPSLACVSCLTMRYAKLGRGSSRELFHSHHEYPLVDNLNEQYGGYDVSWRGTLTISKTWSFCGCLCRYGPHAQRCSCLHRVLKLCNTHVLSRSLSGPRSISMCLSRSPVVRTMDLSCRNSRWRSSRHQSSNGGSQTSSWLRASAASGRIVR